ncbi:DUF3168 domain-containing protein [Rickettsiaceae bacterium]|nr:DUF3168 domain-containing protein [Rickettsiaceae bacterium]
MSLTFIYNFQNQLCSILDGNNEIRNLVRRIYFGAVQDGGCPFLLINIIKAEDLSRHAEFIYSVDFQISAYARDHNHQLLSTLADKIVKLLANRNINFEGYSVAGIKAKDIEFDKARDLVTNKLTINYSALLQKEQV